MIANKGTGRSDSGPHPPASSPKPEKASSAIDGRPVPAPATPAPAPPSIETHHLSDELLAHQAALEIRNAQLEESQRKLEKERKKFNHLFDAAPVGYLILNRKGDITETNLTFALMMGSSRGRIIGKPFSAFVAQMDVDAWNAFLAKVFQGVAKESCDINIHAGDDHAIEVMIDGILNNSGHACLLAVTDITELKRAVEDRFIMAKLDSFNVMAGGIAHDFNNLLSVILMNLDLSRMLIPPSADLQHLMEEADKAVKQATGLTERLLNLGETISPERKPVKLNDFVRHSVELALAGSNVTPVFALADDLQMTHIDPRQFERVIRNIVLNAREAMPEGGTLDVQARNDQLVSHGPTTLPDGAYVRISLIDQGIGIPRADQPKIFDPYFTTKKRTGKKGMGLGLTTCHSIMKKHGGAIFVESEFGAGTRVHLMLPVVHGELAGDIVVEPEASIRLGRILIMDDEDGVRKSIGQVLQVFGHDIAVATEGREAVELYRQAIAEQRPFDVVLLDLTVRDGMNGRETMEQLQQIDPHVKAIVMSGFTQDPVIMNFEDYGFCDYLIKPFGRDQLRESLGKLLREKPPEELEVEAGPEHEYDDFLIVRPVRDTFGRYTDALVEYANDAWRLDFGFKERDPSGISVKQSLPVFADRVHFIFQVAETGKPFRYVKSMPGDESRWFDVQMLPYYDQVIVFSHEVTREYRLEYAIRQSEERFRAALEFAPDITALFRPVFDKIGHFQDVEIIYANRSGMDRWYNGAAVDTIKGHSLFKDHPGLRSNFFDIFRNVAETGREFREVIPEENDRGRWWLDLRVAMFLGGIVYTSRNVTPQKEAEEALRLSLDQLKEAQRAASIGSWECDLAGYAFVWSAELYRIFDVALDTPPEKLSELFWTGIINAADQPLVHHAFARSIGHGQTFRIEFGVTLSGDQKKYIEMRGAVVVGSDGVARRMRGTMQDITERKTTELELIHTQDRLNLAQEAGEVALWDVDLVNRHFFWSPQLFRMFGLDQEKTTASMETWLEVVHPDDRDELETITKAAMEGKGEPASEFRILRPDGNIRWISNRGRVTGNDEGVAVRISGACIDVTERKTTQEKLRQATTQMQAVLGALPDAMFVCDHEGRIFEGRAANVDILGADPKQWIGQSFADVLPPEPANVIAAAIGDAFIHGIHHGGAFSLSLPRGLCWFELSINRTEAGAFIRDEYIILVRDITSRKVTEESLRLKKAELAEAQRIGHIGSWRVNLKNDDVYWSDELFHLTGLTPDALGQAPSLKQQAQTLFTPESAQRLEEAMDECRRTGAPYELAVEIIRPSGEHRHSIARGERDPDAQFITGTFIDITELHHAQARLQDTQRHEMIGRLAGGVAHDFNNQLQAILGLTELMLSRMKPGQPEYEHLIDIQKAGQHSADLTRQLLAFSRRQMIHPVTMILNNEIADMLRMIKRVIGEGVRVDWIPASSLDAILMDPAQLKQVMINLCVNARDAMAGRGVITISTHNITCGKAFCSTRPGFKPGKYVQLTLSDTGAGMTPDLMAHIFEPFFTTKEFGKGAGLGLATVDGAVRQNNGLIEVQSEPGRGTTFRIYFPAYSEPVAIQPQPPGVTGDFPHGHGETILLIDDDRAVLDIGKRLLESLGYQVIATASAAELLQLVRAHEGKIDLLLTDVVMPEMSGPELAAEITRFRPEIKCLFMSGYTANHIAREGSLEQGIEIMDKPFTRKTLSRRVYQLLHS